MRVGIRKVMVCALAFAMISVVFSIVPMDVSPDGTVILHPGYINGAISVPGETVDSGGVWAYTMPKAYQAVDPELTDGDYDLTVEGGYDYRMYATAIFSEEDPVLDYSSTTSIWLESRDTHVEIGETVADFDFTISPGYVDATVTVTGGDIGRIVWYAVHGKVPEYIWHYRTTKTEIGNDVDGSTTFPVMPWSNVDANDDGDYLDLEEGDRSLYVYGVVYIGSIRFYLEERFIDVEEGEATPVSWTLDVTLGTLYGSATVVGETPKPFYVIGDTNIGGTDIHLRNRLGIGATTYSVDVPPSDWSIYPQIKFNDATPTTDWTSYQFLDMSEMAETVTVGPDEAVEHDFYIVPGYVTGTIDLWGACTDLYEAQVYANYERTSNYDAYAFTKTEDYKLILYEGDWIIGVPELFVYFDYDTSTADIDYDFSFIRLQDEYKKQYGDLLSVEAGKSYEVDYSFGTAMVTLNYQIEGGGELYAPDIRSFLREYTIHEGVYVDKLGYGRGSEELTTQGEATITLLEGNHHLTAFAYVEDGSYTKFGDFWMEVEAGDVIVADLDAPNVVVTEPTGLQHVSSSSVTVEGTATDDTGVVSVTVNGVSMTLTSTSNPDDANEVSFTTTVTGLSYGENTITVVAFDEDSKTTKVERIVIRDNDPPEADAGGPYEGDEGSSISFDASGSSDPQSDLLTYRWDFDSDGTWDTDFSTSSSASHTWSDDHTGTVTVQVFDGVNYDTDTAEVTVYNVAPTIDSFSVSPSEPVKLGDLTTVSAGYTDPGSETLTTTIDWGDETSTTNTGDSIEETHGYATTGVYTITLSVTDGAATVDTIYRYVVVYDTDGGFVTGGGWIDSPEGAYVADGTLSGKANFGFVSKYKKGATVPTGNVEFQFKVGDLNFHSSDFDWMVIAGTKAKFKGTGTINGEGNFGFMISAIDGDSKGKDDTFRIKIWDKDNDDAVVYDNQIDAGDDDAPTTALGGGQIVVHKPK